MTFSATRHFSERLERRWLGWEPENALALLDLAEELYPSENHLREVMDWLEEIEIRDGLRPAAVLARDDVRCWLGKPRVSRSDRLKRVKASIWRLRFPRLAGLESQLEAAARRLGLRSRQIEVLFPRRLEGDELTFNIRVRSEEELRLILAHLSECVSSGGIGQLFSLLREA